MLRSSAVAPVTYTHYAPQLGKVIHKAIVALSKDKFVGKTAAILPLKPVYKGSAGCAAGANPIIVSKIMLRHQMGFHITFQRQAGKFGLLSAGLQSAKLSTMKKQLTLGSHS